MRTNNNITVGSPTEMLSTAKPAEGHKLALPQDRKDANGKTLAKYKKDSSSPLAKKLQAAAKSSSLSVEELDDVLENTLEERKALFGDVHSDDLPMLESSGGNIMGSIPDRVGKTSNDAVAKKPDSRDAGIYASGPPTRSFSQSSTSKAALYEVSNENVTFQDAGMRVDGPLVPNISSPSTARVILQGLAGPKNAKDSDFYNRPESPLGNLSRNDPFRAKGTLNGKGEQDSRDIPFGMHIVRDFYSPPVAAN